MGMIDELFPAQSLKQWLELSQIPASRTLIERFQSFSSTQTISQGKKKMEEKHQCPKESSKEEEVENSSSQDSKKTKSDKDEQMKKIHEELKSKLAISEQRKSYDEIDKQWQMLGLSKHQRIHQTLFLGVPCNQEPYKASVQMV